MVENWIECYHHLGAHRNSSSRSSRRARTYFGTGAPWTAMTVESLEGGEGAPDQWMPGVAADARAGAVGVGGVPLLMGGSIARYAFWLQVVPIDVTRHHVTWHVLAHPTAALDAAAFEELMEMFAEVHLEDMATCPRAGRPRERLDRSA